MRMFTSNNRFRPGSLRHRWWPCPTPGSGRWTASRQRWGRPRLKQICLMKLAYLIVKYFRMAGRIYKVSALMLPRWFSFDLFSQNTPTQKNCISQSQHINIVNKTQSRARLTLNDGIQWETGVWLNMTQIHTKPAKQYDLLFEISRKQCNKFG